MITVMAEVLHFDGQVGRGFEQPGLVERDPAHGKGGGTR